jgi:putative transposase
VLAWRLSNTIDTSFCLDALEDPLCKGRPEIFNADQGAQFTSAASTDKLEAPGVRISMGGHGRRLNNVFECVSAWKIDPGGGVIGVQL